MRAHEGFGSCKGRRTGLGCLDAAEARDLIMEYFFEAQYETFARVKERLGTTADEAAIRRSVRGVFRTAFKKVGADLDEPTKHDLVAAIEAVNARVNSRGTPPDIVQKYHAEIEAILRRVPG